METDIENTINEQTGNPGKNSLPLLLKATALLLVVYGILGFGYYATVVVYSMINTTFFDQLEYNNFNGNYLYIPLFIDLLIHIGIILSGFLLLYGKKRGAYYYYFSFFFTVGFSAFILNRFNIPEIVIGSIVLIIILLQSSKLYRKPK